MPRDDVTVTRAGARCLAMMLEHEAGDGAAPFLTPRAMGQAMVCLERRGLVRRQTGRLDTGGIHAWELTDAGRELAEELRDANRREELVR